MMAIPNLPLRKEMSIFHLFLIFCATIAFFVYFLPFAIAWERKKDNKWAIFALNLLAGWTFAGWLGALIWALLKDKPILIRA